MWVMSRSTSMAFACVKVLSFSVTRLAKTAARMPAGLLSGMLCGVSVEVKKFVVSEARHVAVQLTRRTVVDRGGAAGRR